MYFPNAYKKTFFIHPSNGISANALAASGGTSAALLPGQLGIYNTTVGNAISYSPTATSTSIPNAAGSPFYFAMGSWYKTSDTVTSADKIGTHGGYQESVKSKIINPRYISRVIYIAAKGAVNQVIKISAATANSGVSAAGSGLPLDTTYRLRIDAKGAPALRFLNHQLYRTLDYYAPANVANPTFVKHPVYAFLSWKDQINSNPLTAGILQARVYTYAFASASNITAAPTVTTTSAVLTVASTTNVALGQRLIGAGTTPGIPANSFVTAFTGTSITITYPPQGIPPVIGTANPYTLWNEAVSATQTAASTLIPGTLVTTGLASNLTAFNAADASGIVITSGQEPFMEISAAYYDTVFGNATFTPTDYYGVEPLQIQASMVDESGLPSYTSPTAIPAVVNLNTITAVSTQGYFLGSHATEVQKPQSPIGLGEGIIRDLILDGRYRQEAFPDSTRVESFRMREVEQNPVFSSASGVSRSSYYNQLLVLHSVPRFNNPSGTFDTDQYLIQIVIPQTANATTVANGIITAAIAAQGGINSIVLENGIY